MSAGAWCLVSAWTWPWELAPPHGTWSWEYLGESEKHASCDNTLQLDLRDREGRVVDEGCVMFVVTCFRDL